MNHKGTKRIETKRLILRPFRMEDADPMYRNWASDPEVTRYLTWNTHTSVEISKQILADWIESYSDPANYQWAIELKEINEPIGSIAAVEMNENTEAATIGYCIGRKWWGQGIMAEALHAVISFFFEEVGVRCVNACHDPRNPNSGKVMQKCGMKLEGTRRQVGFNNQGICDEVWHSILQQEYFKKKVLRVETDVLLIREAKLTPDLLEILIRMSEDWEKEGSCYGYRKNDRSDIEGNRIFTAEIRNEVVGYLFGHMEKAERASSIMPDGTPFFEAEELYVKPQYRSQGIGRRLFEQAEKAVSAETEFILLSTATKNWKAIFHFYLDELGMEFWSSRLFKDG